MVPKTTTVMALISFAFEKPYILEGIHYKTEEEFIDGMRVILRELKARYEYEKIAQDIDSFKLKEIDPVIED